MLDHNQTPTAEWPFWHCMHTTFNSQFLCILCVYLCTYVCIWKFPQRMMWRWATAQLVNLFRKFNTRILDSFNITTLHIMKKWLNTKYMMLQFPFIYSDAPVCSSILVASSSPFFFNPSITVQHHMKYVNFLSAVFRRSLVVFFRSLL